MRIFIGNGDEDPRASAVDALDRDIAIEGKDTLANANQSEGTFAVQLLVADSAPVIAHLGLDETFALFDAHLHPAGAGVPRDVRERFLDDAVERRCARPLDGNLLRPAVQGALDAAAAGGRLPLFARRRGGGRAGT